jgi:hypothetical protein
MVGLKFNTNWSDQGADSPRRGFARLPLSPTASHRGAKSFLLFKPSLLLAGERVVQRSVIARRKVVTVVQIGYTILLCKSGLASFFAMTFFFIYLKKQI